MELESFIGKVVVSSKTKKRYVIYKITSPEILVRDELPDENGNRKCFGFATINTDPITNGALMFEDKNLTEPFKMAFSDYCHSSDAYWEELGYWMRR